MAETKNEQAKQPTHESQKERWLKYGVNVVVATVVVILLAGVVVYLAQRAGRRIDTTESGAYSLKPQTLNLIRDLQGKTKIVSLYQKTTNQAGGAATTDYATVVNDLLDEYRRKGRNIEVDAIDPVANPSKVDDLIAEVTEKYGGEVAQYKQVIDRQAKTYAQIKEIASAEAAKVADLKLDDVAQDESSQDARDALLTANNLARLLQRSEDLIKRRMEEKPPGYKAAVTSVEETMSLMSRVADQVIAVAGQAKDAKLPEPVKQALASSVPAYENIRKIADELHKQAQGVGELKLDDLRQSLRARDAVLVMGPSDMRVIPFEQVWRADDQQIRQYVPGQELKPRFAGEQQITTAIHALNQATKPKVVFVRGGGAPLTEAPMGPFGGGGPMSQVAERLRQYNFEVLEKDLSGMWAMQSQMRQMPAAPEPSDEEIRDAIWIVLAFPTGQQQNPMMPPPTIAPRVADHLRGGGSAMIIFAPQVDNMDDVMKEYGIQVRSDAVAVHEMIATSEGRQGDAIEEALRYPFVFDIRDYGDHMITRPLRSLASWLVPMLSVEPTDTTPPGVKVTPIIPIPQEPRSWGETDLQALQDLSEFKFDEGTDVPGPIWGGAVAEKELPATTQPATAPAGVDGKRTSRLVVVASPMFAFDRYINEPDVNLLRRGLIVSRFPANLELFSNSVFWLARMEPMIAISPAAMEIARIEPMSDGALRAWRVGGLLIGLPGLVVVAGAMVYFARRD